MNDPFTGLPSSSTPEVTSEPRPHESQIAHHGERVLTGIPASPGIVIGRVQVVDSGEPIELESFRLSDQEVESEIEAFQEAVELSRRQINETRQQVVSRLNEAMAAIFDYHLMILDDPMVIGATIKAVRQRKQDAASLFNQRVEALTESFRKIEDSYFRARSTDLADVARRVLSNLGRIQRGDLHLQHDKTVVVAHDLTPSDTAHLDPARVAAFITDKGGPTSHSVILARSLHIPAIVGLEKATARAVNGQLVVVDGVAGRVIFNPAPETLREYEKYYDEFQRFEADLGRLANQPAETPDGFHVDLAANIELPGELPAIAKFGAQGIGLYRTEFLFLDDKPPSEAEQYAHYRDALEAVGNQWSVTFRTLDIGGDKHTRALPTIEEANPYLGLRAVRFCLAHPHLFRTQLRALLRASAHGRARLLLPMISSIEELRKVRGFIDSVMEELEREGTPFDHAIRIGIMIEVPSAALMADKLAREVDFFSIGTNDLIQYTLAVDRGNDLVAYLYNAFEPSVLRLVSTVIDAAHRNGIVANLCGEMASDPTSAILLLGLGIDELSMTAAAIPRVKQVIRHFRLADAREIAQEILHQGSITDVRRVVDERVMPVIKGLELPRISWTGAEHA